MKRSFLVLFLAFGACSGDDAPPSIDVDGVDAGSADAASACDPVAQTGCDTGEKCAAVRAGAAYAVACVPDGVVGPGGACVDGDGDGATDDCAGGHTCVFGVCRENCSPDPADTCTAADEVCEWGFTSLPFDVCTKTCDVFAQDCPAQPAQACVIDTAAPAEVGYCAYLIADGELSDGLGLGEACSFINECAAGLACVGTEQGGSACTQICDLAQGSGPDAPNQACVDGPGPAFGCYQIGNVDAPVGFCFDNATSGSEAAPGRPDMFDGARVLRPALIIP